MSLRKFVSLLLLVAFALTTVPAKAATLASSATLPTTVQEAGTIANGANLDVVPVTITVNQVTAGSLEFMLVDFQGTVGDNNGTTLSITANGKLSVGGNGTILGGSNEKAFIITPPTGTKFVGLTAAGYTTNGVTLIENGAMVTENIGGTVANNVLPGLGTNGNALIARVLTEAGPSTYFGSGVTVPAGSIVAYFATGDNDTGTNPVGTSFSFTNFGLAVNPTGESTGTLTGNLSATYEEPGTGASIDEAIGSGLADGATLAITQVGTSSKLEFGMAASEDSEANTVLGVLLTTAGNGVTISPAEITSSSSSSALKVDTDALYIRAKEISSGSGTYYQTPFATSEYTGSIIDVNGNVSIFNRALTNTSSFPNTSDALITVEFQLLDPTTSTAYATSDATIDVTACSVSLVGEDIDTDIRGAITQANGGFLGSIIETINDNGGTAASETNTAVAVLYNGDSATSVLTVVDASRVDELLPSIAATGLAHNSGGVAPGLTVITAANNAATTSTVSPFVNGIFNGVFVSSDDTDDGRDTVAVSAVNGTLSTTYKLTLGNVPDYTAAGSEALFTPSEVTVRLTDTTNGANAWFVITGNHAGDDMTDAAGEIRVGPSNSATFAGAVVQSTDDSAVGIADNAIAIARLSGNTLSILPIINHYDAERDAMIIRPEIALKLLTTTARTNGAKVVAVANGNNLTSTTVTVAQVTGTGSLDVDIIAKAIPVSGDFDTILVENGDDVFGTDRFETALTTIDGSTNGLDNYADLIDTANGFQLDETLPTLFCGGSIGTGKKGPNGVVSQSKGIGILISENGQAGSTSSDAAFSTVADNSNTVIRVTLPEGWDINKFSATQGEILNAFSTGGLGSFDVADFDIQGISSDAGVSQAYVDISGFTVSASTVPMDRAFVLVFKQDALVAPVGVTDFTATISMVYDNGTSTTADDTLLATIGTVDLGTACGTGLELSFCDDVLSTGATVSYNSALESNLTTNGANLTTFSSTPTGALRLVRSNTVAETVLLPDLCLSEGSADLFSVGAKDEGGFAAAGTVHIFPSATASDAIHFANAAAQNLSLTDNSVTLSQGDDTTGNLGGAGDEFSFTVTDAGGSTRPDEVISRIRIPGVTLEGPDTTIYSAQDLVAIYTDGVNDTSAIGASFPMQYYEDSTNGDAIVNRLDDGDDADHIAAHFYNADVLDDTALTLLVFNGDDAALTFAFDNTTATILSSAVTSQVDNDSYDQLNEDKVDLISVDVSDITGSDSKKVIISAPAGTLEPKSTIAVTLSGSGSTDTVTVPVLADGSFQATVTADTTQTIILTQTPSSGRTDLPPQIVELDVADANVEPKLLSATVQSLGLGTIPSKGTVPVIVKLTATGKVDGDAYVPVASELTIGGAAATAVTGTTDQFMAVVDPSQPIQVVSSAGSGSTVTATLTTAATTKGGKPVLKKVKNNKKGYVVMKGKRLTTNDGSFAFLADDGTVTVVNLRNTTRGDRSKNRRRSESVLTIPTDAVYGIFISPSRGVSTLEL